MELTKLERELHDLERKIEHLEARLKDADPGERRRISDELTHLRRKWVTLSISVKRARAGF